MRLLIFTSEWPSATQPQAGIFIAQQVASLQKLGLEIDVLAWHGQKKVQNYWQAINSLKKTLQQSPYAIVHAHVGHSGFLASFLRFYPLVVTFHGSDVFGIVQPNNPTQHQNAIKTPYNLLGSHLFWMTSTIAATFATEAIVVCRRMLQKLPPRQKPYHVLPTALDTKIFHPPNPTALRQQLENRLGPRILFVGSPKRPEKRFHFAKAAFWRLQQHLPQAQLHIVYGQPRQVVAKAMQQADILLLCSSHEGSPNVIKEALACGLAVVSCDVGDVAEFFEQQPQVIILKEDTAEACAQAVQHLWSRRYQRLENSKQTQLLLQSFKEDVIAKKLLDIYQQLV